MQILITFIVNLFLLSAGYHDPYFVGNRSTIVHLFEWKWNDIAIECEKYLGPEGFGAVQVSPVNENAILPNRPWYERYQPISYIFITRSGNREELKDMIKRCNSVGVRVYVDAVINHMAARDLNKKEIIGTGNSIARPGDRDFPSVPYTAEDFNPVREIKNYLDPVEVRNCELTGLKDLNQTREHVRNKIIEYFNDLIDIGVGGFRIDAAKHMWPQDLQIIYKRIKNLNVDFQFPDKARPFIYQEVIDLGGENIKKEEYKDLGRVLEFKFSAEIGNLFRGNNQLKWLNNWGPQWNLLESKNSVVFVDNHDNQRGHGGGGTVLTYKNEKLYKLASVFMLTHPYAVPRIMSSYYFTDPSQGPPKDNKDNIISPEINAQGYCVRESGWVCEHRWNEIKQMVKFRNIVGDAPLIDWWDNGKDAIAFSRGKKGFVMINNESNEINTKIKTNFKSGRYCNLFEGSKIGNQCVGIPIEVDKTGLANIVIDSKKAIVLLFNQHT